MAMANGTDTSVILKAVMDSYEKKDTPLNFILDAGDIKSVYGSVYSEDDKKGKVWTTFKEFDPSLPGLVENKDANKVWIQALLADFDNNPLNKWGWTEFIDDSNNKIKHVGTEIRGYHKRFETVYYSEGEIPKYLPIPGGEKESSWYPYVMLTSAVSRKALVIAKLFEQFCQATLRNRLETLKNAILATGATLGKKHEQPPALKMRKDCHLSATLSGVCEFVLRVVDDITLPQERSTQLIKENEETTTTADILNSFLDVIEYCFGRLEDFFNKRSPPKAESAAPAAPVEREGEASSAPENTNGAGEPFTAKPKKKKSKSKDEKRKKRKAGATAPAE